METSEYAASNQALPDRRAWRAEASNAVNRREFLKAALATGVVVGAGPQAWPAETKGAMPYRTLGRTGEKVSAIGLGGFHIGSPKDEQEGIRIILSAGTATPQRLPRI